MVIFTPARFALDSRALRLLDLASLGCLQINFWIRQWVWTVHDQLATATQTRICRLNIHYMSLRCMIYNFTNACDYKIGCTQIQLYRLVGVEISIGDTYSGPMVVWLKVRPVDRRVAGSIPESANFLTVNGSGQGALDSTLKQLTSFRVSNILVLYFLYFILTLWCPSSPSSKSWYQLASGLGWDTVSINVTQSHSGEHLVAKQLYAILKYV